METAFLDPSGQRKRTKTSFSRSSWRIPGYGQFTWDLGQHQGSGSITEVTRCSLLEIPNLGLTVFNDLCLLERNKK